MDHILYLDSHKYELSMSPYPRQICWENQQTLIIPGGRGLYLGPTGPIRLSDVGLFGNLVYIMKSAVFASDEMSDVAILIYLNDQTSPSDKMKYADKDAWNSLKRLGDINKIIPNKVFIKYEDYPKCKHIMTKGFRSGGECGRMARHKNYCTSHANKHGVHTEIS